LILSVLQGVSFIMSRDSCTAQGHVEGHTHLCRLLQTLTVLPPVGETPALSAPASRAHIFDVVGVLQRYATRAFAEGLYERPEEFNP